MDLLESLTRKWSFLPRFNAVVFARGGDQRRQGKKDIYWGVNTITWEGDNRLGELLMKVRDDMRREGEGCPK